MGPEHPAQDDNEPEADIHEEWFDSLDDGYEYEPICDLENPESCESCT